MSFYRENFHENLTPKMHVLEEHIVPFIKKWNVGTGLMGEQGAESIHAAINRIKQRFRAIPNKEKQLLCVIKEHHLQVSPSNQSRAPPAAKRKRKGDD